MSNKTKVVLFIGLKILQSEQGLGSMKSFMHILVMLLLEAGNCICLCCGCTLYKRKNVGLINMSMELFEDQACLENWLNFAAREENQYS